MSRIEASPCRFLCIATPKPFSQITSSSVFSSDNADRWENYPPDRDRVREAIDALSDPRVVFVTGDIHMNYLGRTTLDGTAASERCWEVCCTSGNYSPLASSLSEVQFDFVSPEPHFPVLAFDPDSGTVEVTFYDVDGNVAFSQVLDDFGPSAS